MAFEVNELSGSLFDNDKTNDRQPDMTGNCKIDGVEYWVSAWVKESRGGTEFLSMAYTQKDNQQSPRSQSPKPERKSFTAKKRGASSARKEQQEADKTKFEKDMKEFENMTEGKFDDFDDDIPF